MDLVTSLDAVPTNAIRQQDLDKPTLLWTGTSGEAHAALCAALDAASISYSQQQRDVGILPGLAQPVYAVFVRARDLNGARLVLEHAAEHFETDSSARADDAPLSPEHSPDAEVDDNSVPDDIAGHFNPADATQQVWSGQDSDTAETVRVCLRENGIGCLVEDSGADKAVLVTPDSEPRAREIIHEIVGGAPSQ